MKVSGKVGRAIQDATLYSGYTGTLAALVRQMEAQAGRPLDTLSSDDLITEAEAASEILGGIA